VFGKREPFGWIVCGSAALMVSAAATQAAFVPLQNATATSHQTNFAGISTTIDGVIANSNDGIAFQSGDGLNFGNNILVWETQSDLTGPGVLTVDLHQVFNLNQFTLQRFRLSVTSADRSSFADGNPSDGSQTPFGNTGADGLWTVLEPTSLSGTNGATFTEVGGGVIEVGGSPNQSVYTITADSPLSTITGMRLEVMSAGNNGQVGFVGNAVLSEVELDFVSGGTLADNPLSGVTLTNPTATFAQATGQVSEANNSLEYGSNQQPDNFDGWAVNGNQNSDNAAVFQTDAPLSTDQVVIEVNHTASLGNFALRRFRLSYTTDANPTAGGGNTWVTIDPTSARTARDNSTATEQGDQSVLITRGLGGNNLTDSYQVVADLGSIVTGITGFRIETLEDTDSGQWSFSGDNNFILNEFNVFATTVIPEPGAAALAFTGLLCVLPVRRRRL